MKDSSVKFLAVCLLSLLEVPLRATELDSKLETAARKLAGAAAARNLAGAVDSRTAAQIGKLAGAKLLVLRNVIQLGNSSQLTSKLVDAETGEMITSEITEVPVKTFD